MPEMHAQLVALADDCIVQMDLEGRVTSVNDLGLKLLGLSDEASVMGRDWRTLWPAEFRVTAADAFSSARLGHPTRFVGATVAPDETRCWWSVSIGPLGGGDAARSVGAILRDIAERVALERSLQEINDALRARLSSAGQQIALGGKREVTLADELARAERALIDSDRRNASLREHLDLARIAQAAAEGVAHLAQKGEAVGQLVAGMAHDLNNTLQTLMAALDALAIKDELGPRQELYVERASAAAGHAADMTRRLLAFSAAHPYRPEEADLHDIAENTASMLEGALGTGMRMEVAAAAEPLPVMADIRLVQQCLLNLCINARDACEGQGHIRVSLGIEQVSPEAGTLALPAGEYAFVQITDDGPGMSDDVRELLFQPFFTTKAPGKGTGLGMAQVLGTMRQAGGFVSVETALGEGTSVRLLFPAVRASRCDH